MLAIAFVIFLIVITTAFVSVRNNHGMMTVLSVGYFSDDTYLYTVALSGNEGYELTENSVGKTVAYMDEKDGMTVKAGLIEEIEEVKDYELPKVKMKDGTSVKVRNIVGTVSGKSGAGVFNAVTTKKGYILCMCIPGILFIIYYLVSIILYYRKSAKPVKSASGKPSSGKQEKTASKPVKKSVKSRSKNKEKDGHDDLKESF